MCQLEKLRKKWNDIDRKSQRSIKNEICPSWTDGKKYKKKLVKEEEIMSQIDRQKKNI